MLLLVLNIQVKHNLVYVCAFNTCIIIIIILIIIDIIMNITKLLSKSLILFVYSQRY